MQGLTFLLHMVFSTLLASPIPFIDGSQNQPIPWIMDDPFLCISSNTCNMNVYHMAFYTVYFILTRKATANIDRIIGAVSSSLLLTMPVFYAFLSIPMLIGYKEWFITNWLVNFNSYYYFGGVIIISVFNILYFMLNKKYLKIEEYMNRMDKEKRMVFLFLGFFFWVGSGGFHFWLLGD